ncbi:DegT/DnrJ/EryC1/StrS family aminotransferase [Kribbella albertanoniae]|nr:DegT/DnrJ/EryC1/StrS family aminotransferase [Kribbella albertanoniae]
MQLRRRPDGGLEVRHWCSSFERRRALTIEGVIAMQESSGVPGAGVRVPFRDLRRLHNIGQQESRAALDRAIDSCDFARPNQLIEEFESKFAEYCGVRYAVATSSGSSALLLAYLAHGIGAGDEILTVPNTFVATAEAAIMLGARVRLVDVDPVTQAIDQGAAIRMLTPSTKAVVPLHPFGRAAGLELLRSVTRERGIALIEEACHAHGARRVGRVGDSAVFSFGPTKPLAGLGEGGAVVTDDERLAGILRQWNNHGRDGGSHRHLGLNFRIHPMEAAYLTSRLALLPGLLDERRMIAARYNDAFAEYGVTGNPAVRDPTEHSYYVYVLDVPQRARFCRRLSELGIGWDIHYPVAIHRQPAHEARFRAAALPQCDRLQERIISLPMINGLRKDEIDEVVTAVRSVLEEVTAE